MKWSLFILSIFLFFDISAAAQDIVVYDDNSETVVLESETGYYHITYWGADQDTLEKSMYIPGNLIDPDINAVVSVSSSPAIYTYQYTVTNGPGGSWNLARYFLDIKSSVIASATPGVDWDFNPITRSSVYFWSHGKGQPAGGISPNTTVSGFSVTSPGLPSIQDCSTANATWIGFVDEGPASEVNVFFRELIDETISVPCRTLSPLDPPTSFDGSEIIQTVIDYNNEANSVGWYLDSNIYDSIDLLLQSAKSSIEGNNYIASIADLNQLLTDLETSNKVGNDFTSEVYPLLKYNIEYLIHKKQNR